MRILTKKHKGKVVENIGQFKNLDIDIIDDGEQLGHEDIPQEFSNKDNNLQLKNYLGHVQTLNDRSKKIHLLTAKIGQEVTFTVKYLVE